MNLLSSYWFLNRIHCILAERVVILGQKNSALNSQCLFLLQFAAVLRAFTFSCVPMC